MNPLTIGFFVLLIYFWYQSRQQPPSPPYVPFVDLPFTPDVLPPTPIPSLPADSGTIRGERGEGLRQQRQFIMSLETPNPGQNLRKNGQMLFTVRMINMSDEPISIALPLRGAQSNLTGQMQFAVVKPLLGQTPKWFIDLSMMLAPIKAQLVYTVIRGLIPEAPGEIGIEMIDSMQGLIRRKLPSAERTGGTYAEWFMPGEEKVVNLIWDYRNQEGEPIAAGNYMTIAWFRLAENSNLGQPVATGWMRIIVL